MKALVCHAPGPLEALQLEDMDLPPPGPREVRVKVAACGINFPDVLMVQGKYQEQQKLPFIPGGEVSGTVVEAGREVMEFQAGDRVMAVTFTGGLAEFMNIRLEGLQPLPASMSLQTAAAFPGVYGTSYHALRQRAHLRPGENLLVLGATGGVGLAAVQIGKAMGANVIAAAGSDAKVEFLKQAGVEHVINYRSQDLRETVKALTNGKGADVIYDPVGGDLFDQSMRCIAWNGRILVVGFASGRIPELPVNRLLLKGASAIGVFWSRFLLEQDDEAGQNRRELAALFEQGQLQPHIHQVFPLEKAVDALRALTSREVIGKVIVQCAA